MLVILGPTGAGKSSQAKRLATKFDSYVWIEIGGVLRNSVDQTILKTLKKGLLISDDLVTALMAEAIGKVSGAKQPLLDGYPRSMGQTDRLESISKRLKRRVLRVVYLKISRDIANRRLKLRGRMDDKSATIDQKWQVFMTETLPVIEHYRRKGIVAEIDGSGNVEDVGKNIELALSL